MYKNRYDLKKNRLYISFQGKIDKDEIISGSNEVLGFAKLLRPGFGVISDISEFIPTSEEGRLVMQDSMKTLLEMGMTHVVRVVPQNKKVSGFQWQRTSMSVGYKALEVSAFEEAEKALDEIEHNEK